MNKSYTNLKEINMNEPSDIICFNNSLRDQFGEENLKELELIRRIISIEEERRTNFEDVLTRVLDHYNLSVKYR